MQFIDDSAAWASALSEKLIRTQRAVQALEQLCDPNRDDLASTMQVALAWMAIRDAEVQRLRNPCDFSDLLTSSPPTTPAVPPTP
jgi:hypothetical protein